MIGVILYIGAVLAVSGILSFMFIVTRPVHVRDDMRSWRTFIISFFVCAALPYVAFEVMTKQAGPELRTAVEDGTHEAEIDGDLARYKVIWFDGKTATVLAISEMRAKWGGMDHPVTRLKLSKNEKGKWKLLSHHVLVSDDLERDQVVFPPVF